MHMRMPMQMAGLCKCLMAFILMACKAMAYALVAYIVMAYMVMAYMETGHHLLVTARRNHRGICSLWPIELWSIQLRPA